MTAHVMLLQVHNKPDQVMWLAEHCRDQGAFVVIHVDAKAAPVLSACREYFSGQSGIHILENRVSVNWSGFSQVQATLTGIDWIRTQIRDYGYLHLMSGECLPLLPLDQMDKLLRSTLRDHDLIECRPRPGYEWRINRFNILGENPRNREHYHTKVFKLFRDLQGPFPPRNNFAPNEIVFGSQWWSLRREALDRMFATDMSDFVRRFRWTRCADEHFFQILYARTGLQTAGSRRWIEFPDGAASPRHLSIDDLVKAADGGALFARKVGLDTAKEYVRRFSSSVS